MNVNPSPLPRPPAASHPTNDMNSQGGPSEAGATPFDFLDVLLALLPGASPALATPPTDGQSPVAISDALAPAVDDQEETEELPAFPPFVATPALDPVPTAIEQSDFGRGTCVTPEQGAADMGVLKQGGPPGSTPIPDQPLNTDDRSYPELSRYAAPATPAAEPEPLTPAPNEVDAEVTERLTSNNQANETDASNQTSTPESQGELAARIAWDPTWMDARATVERPTKKDSSFMHNANPTVHSASVTGSTEGSRPPETVSPPMPLPERIRDAFAENLHQLREHGRVEVHMDLHPPELGKVRLHLSMEENDLHLRMVVHDEAAKQILEQQTEPLRVHFAEMGVHLGQLDVRHEGSPPPGDDGHPRDDSGETTSPMLGRRSPIRHGYSRSIAPDALVDVIA